MSEEVNLKVLIFTSLVLLTLSMALPSRTWALPPSKGDARAAAERGLAAIDSWQTSDGYWPGWYMPGGGSYYDKNYNLIVKEEGEWWNVSSTSYSVQAIHTAHQVGMHSSFDSAKALEYLLCQQYENGHWPGEHLYRGTKDAILGLLALGKPTNLPEIQDGVEWLRDHLSNDGCWIGTGGPMGYERIYTHSEILIGFGSATQQSDTSTVMAAEWIRSHQQTDGSICEPGYGRPAPSTIWSIQALLACGEPAGSELLVNAVEYLESCQNLDGGWSQYGYGQPSECLTTADAVIAMLESGTDPAEATVQASIRFILDSQQPEGYWVPLGWPEYRFYLEATTAQCVRALCLWIRFSIDWEYVFTDPARGTMLKISTDDKYFQFVASDKDFEIKFDPNMRLSDRVMFISFKDTELTLLAVAFDTKLDFCAAYALDLHTGKLYYLWDKPGIE